MYYTYIIRCEDNSLYTGITTDLDRRIKEHLSHDKTNSNYTKVHKAVKFEIAFESVNRSRASKLESAIKSLSKSEKEQIIIDASLEVLSEKMNINEYFAVREIVKPMRNNKMKFRFAKRKDVGLILDFIKNLAEYEKMSDEVVATEEILTEWLFEKKKAEVIFVMEKDKEVGFALFFHNFSTFLGRAGIYLEDLFVLPEYRGKGYGKGLIQKLAQITVERECGRLEWCCMDWNKPSIDFYLSLDAKSMDIWTTYRLTGESLKKVAKGE